MTSTDPTLAAAAAHHDAGRLPEAEQAYREYLASHPDDLNTTIRLGDVLADAGRAGEAATCYQRAIDAASNDPAAAAAYEGLAAILQDQGNLPRAAAASLRAVELRRDADAAYTVGVTLERLGRIPEAIEAFRLATRLKPKFAEAHAHLGGLLLATGNPEAAVNSYEVAVTVKPDLAEAHCNLAVALRRTGSDDLALASAKRAIELKPDLAEAHNVIGAIWKDRRRLADALAAFTRATELKPEYAEALNNGASVLEQLGRVTDATGFFQRAVRLRPKDAAMHVNLAHNLLLVGQYAQGWAENEWRRQDPTNPASRQFPRPQWDGKDLAGRTIFLHAEQGFGDTIQFARFIPLVAARGGKVVIECQPALAPVICRVSGATAAFMQFQTLPAFDVHAPLLSLPLILSIGDNVPTDLPYITPSPEKVPQWAAKVRPAEGKLRVGIAWAGNPRHKNDRARSCPPALLEPLGGVEGVAFFSLQKDADPAALPALRLTDMTPEFRDFADTAALIANLDLVITVDTAVAHLAGAMGKPVWLMLPSLPDWRWGLDREESRWYPTMRLFRQSTSGDWASVITRIETALTERAAPR